MREDDWWFTCPICEKQQINKISESGKIGACALCRDSIIPKHIPFEQHPRYIQQYLMGKNELYNM